MWPRPSARCSPRWPAAGAGSARRPNGAGVPYETARGWVRRFRARGRELGVAFAALAVELGGAAVTPPAWAGRFALAAVGAAFAAAAAGVAPGGRVAVRLSGDRREAGRRQHSLALVRGRQAAFHASYPAMTRGERRTAWIEPARADRVAPVGGDRRGCRGQAHAPGARRHGLADRRPGAPASGRVVPHLLARQHRPVAAGLAQGWAGGAQARGASGYRDGACPPGDNHHSGIEFHLVTTRWNVPLRPSARSLSGNPSYGCSQVFATGRIQGYFRPPPKGLRALLGRW